MNRSVVWKALLVAPVPQASDFLDTVAFPVVQSEMCLEIGFVGSLLLFCH